MSAGKGDTPRPCNKARFDRNFAAIDWRPKKPKRPARRSR